MNNHLISVMIFLPFLGALMQTLVPQPRSRWIALVASTVSSLCAVVLVASMHQSAEAQSIESFPWIGSYAITYEMAIDGLNALPVLLVAILCPILIAAEWKQKIGIRGMHGLFLILQTALFGAACAQDLFLMFFFWGLSALPFYFLVGIWGGEKREQASFNAIVTAALSNALIFSALILIYYSVDPHSFLLRELSGGKFVGKQFEILGHTLSISTVSFSLICFGLALRAPIWPIHGWFTEVAQEAPSSVFVALCAGVIPMATYILVKVCYVLFPETLMSFAHTIVFVGALNLLLGGLCGLAQKGLKRLLAFICISEVGLVLMGIGSLSPTGVVGAVYQQLMLGLGLAGFGLVSGIIFDRTGFSDFLDESNQRTYGGIATRAPFASIFAGFIIASILGFPGLGGFVGHALIVIGSFSIYPTTVVVIAAALLLASYHLFSMYRFVFLGKPSARLNEFEDLTAREKVYLLPIVMAIICSGFYPKPLIELIRPTVLSLLSTMK